MSALGSLVVKLALEYAEYTRGLEQSDQANLRFAQNAQRHFDNATAAGKKFMSGAVTAAVGAAAAFVSVNAVLDQLGRSIDNLAALDDLTQKTGSSVENLSRLQQVASAFGTDFGKVDVALSKLAKGMAGVDEDSSKTQKALAALGVSAKDASGNLRDPSEVLVDAAKGLQGYEDGAAKAALMIDLLGKSGADLLPYLNDVAESVDKFTGASAEAAAQAARYQDQLGLLRVKYEGLFTSLATSALPALNDLLGAFQDVHEEESKLAGADVSGWVDDLAVGIARVVDVAKLLPGIFSAIGGSFKAVYADIELAATLANNLSPTTVAMKLSRGENPVENMRKALAERNKVLDDANRRYEELWNKPANLMEQAVLARIAARVNPAAADAGKSGPQGEGKKTLSYTTGDDKKAEKGDYEQLNKALQEKIALSAKELELAHPLTEAERQMATLLRGRAEGTVKLTDGEMKLLESGLMQLSLNQQLLLSRGQAELQRQAAAEANQKSIADAFDSAAAVEAEVAAFGKLPSQITRATIAKLQSRKASLEANEGTEQEIATTNALIIANERRAAAQEKLASLTTGSDLAHATELLQVMEAVDEAAKRAASGMEASFGRVGAAIGGLTTVLTGYSKAQAAIAAQLTAVKADPKNGAEKVAQAEMAASKASAQAQIKSYGDMAGAAKGFFKENTAGYKLLQGTEKAFRAYEMGLAIESMVTKLFATEAVTTAVVAGKGFESAAMIGAAAVDTTTTGVSVANSAVKTTASTIAGVAKAFEQLGVYGFIGAAAIIAFMASMGSSASGGGGAAPTTFEERQKKQGTGTVLGDDTAKSESIANSLEIIEANSGLDLDYQNSMLQALKNIESALGGAAKGIFQTAGLTGGSAFGTANESVKSFFGSSKSTTITDTGVKFSGSLGQLRTGTGNGVQYEDVTKTSDGGWFHGNSSHSSTNTKALSDAALKPFTLIFENMGELLVGAGVKLGEDGKGLANAINQIGIDFSVSTRELKGQDLVDALSAGVSVAFDQVTAAVFPQIADFQKVGEGMGETLVRVASNYAALDSILASSGAAFGKVGMGSIAAREHLIDLAGGIDKLESKTTSFNENFLSEAEQLAPVQKYVTEQLAAMGRAGLDTRDKFKEAVLGLASSGALATEAGAKEYVGLLDLADAFAKTHAATKDLSKSTDEIASEREDLQDRYDELTMTSTQLLNKQRDALDGSNRALFDNVQAETRAQEVVEERKGLQEKLDDLTLSSIQLLEKQRNALDASNRSLFDQVQAETKARAARDERKALQDQFDQLTMTSTQLLDKQRAALDASNRSLFDQVQAETKAKEVRGERKTLQDQLDQLTMTSTQLLNKQRAALDASNRALFDQVQAAKSASSELTRVQEAAQRHAEARQQRIDSARTAVSEAYEREAGALKEVVTKSQEAAKAHRAYSESLLAGSLSPLSMGDRLEVLRRQFKTASPENLQSASAAYLELLRTESATSLEYSEGFAEVQNALEAAAVTAEGQATVAQQQLTALDAAVSGIVAVQAAVLSVRDALASYQAAMSAPVYYAAAFVAATAPAKQTLTAPAKNYTAFNTIPIGAHANGGVASGWSLVGEEGPELVNFTQPGRVYTAQESRAMMGATDSSAVVAELRRLRDEVALLKGEAIKTAENTKQSADVLDKVTAGGNAMLMEAAT